MVGRRLSSGMAYDDANVSGRPDSEAQLVKGKNAAFRGDKPTNNDDNPYNDNNPQKIVSPELS
jgi:hypothetical protein